MIQTIDIPVGHIDDVESMVGVLDALRTLHGASYDFAVGRWEGETNFEPKPGRVAYRFIIEAEGGAVALKLGDLIRGPDPHGPYRALKGAALTGAWAEATAAHFEGLWPGDMLTVDDRHGGPLALRGRGVYFEVTTEQTAYRAPRLAMLRHLTDYPGGCAAYPGAFRREALPPERPAPEAADQRGLNRVNEHTLDMRYDRTPPPIRHYHGPIPNGQGQMANHSETAIILPRVIYNLPEVAEPDQGHIVIYRRPAEDLRDKVTIPVRPGSIVVTPATSDGVAGHCFENAFAMLVAIPGFVAPYNFIEM